MVNCDLFLDEHTDGTCSDPRHAKVLATIAARAKGASWSPIVPGCDGGGRRDYLDGKPIHCGATLELQAYEYRSDDYGEYHVMVQRGDLVRYERSAGQVTLYASVAGHTFTAEWDGGMRFRWPQRKD